MIDLGSRFNYDIGKVTLSLEYLKRLDITQNDFADYRLAFIGQFALIGNLYATCTFGKNFTQTNNIIALAGINLGYSRSKLKL